MWKLDEIQNLASATSKMISWPQQLRKGLSDFFKNYIFKIRASSWEKWAIARISSQNFTSFYLCILKATKKWLKICNSKSQDITHFSQIDANDLKNVTYEKIHWGPSEVKILKLFCADQKTKTILWSLFFLKASQNNFRKKKYYGF